MYGKVSDSRRRGGISARIRCCSGSLESLSSWTRSCGRQVALGPEGHQERGVPFRDGQGGERAVALADRVEVEVLQPEVLILEGVVELVGEGHPLGRAETARPRDDVELLRVVVVVARRPGWRGAQVERLEVRPGRDQAHQLVDPLGGGELIGRVRREEALLDVRLEGGFVEELRVDRGLRLQAAELLDLGLDRGVDRGVVGRPGGATRAADPSDGPTDSRWGRATGWSRSRPSGWPSSVPPQAARRSATATAIAGGRHDAAAPGARRVHRRIVARVAARPGPRDGPASEWPDRRSRGREMAPVRARHGCPFLNPLPPRS